MATMMSLNVLPARAVRLSARRAVSAAAARPAAVRPVALRMQTAVIASAEGKTSASAPLPAALFTLAATLSQAGAAEAAVSPSLKNLLLSVLAGGSVLAVIAVGVIAVSNFDKVSRE